MPINGFPRNFTPTAPFVETRGGLLTQDAVFLMLALFNRTGDGDGAPSVKVGVAAAGTTQATATVLSGDWNYVEIVPSGSGVILPLFSTSGLDCIVFNADAADLNVYPPISNVQPIQIDALVGNAPHVLHAGKMQWYRSIKPALIKTMQLQTG
jgi:hypothetical protein